MENYGRFEIFKRNYYSGFVKKKKKNDLIAFFPEITFGYRCTITAQFVKNRKILCRNNYCVKNKHKSYS